MSASSARKTIGRLAALLWPYLILVGARVILCANGYYPVLQPDEVIYREAARFFAGVGPTPNLADGYLFPMGYPLLVAPLWWLFDTLEGLGAALLLVNAAVASAVYFPVRFLVARFSEASPAVTTAAALVTGLYPAHFAITNLWATDNAFVPLFVLLAAAGWRLFEAPSPKAAALFGALAAALYCVHERALLIVAVAALQLVWTGFRRQLPRREAAIGLGAMAAGFAAVRWLMASAVSTLYRGDPVERPLGVVLGKLLELEGWTDVLLQAAGQGWYLLVATYGLGGIGLMALLDVLRRDRGTLVSPGESRTTARSQTALFLVASAAAVFGTTIIYFPENPIMSLKPEFFFFGRICEGVVSIFLALGLARLASARTVSRIPIALAAWLGGAVALGAVMVAGRGMDELSDGPGTYGVFGVRWFLRDETWQMHPVAGTVVLGAVAVAAAWFLRRRPLVLASLVGVSFLWVSSEISIHYMGRRLERTYARAIPGHLEQAGGTPEIAFDTRGIRVGRYAELVRRVENHQFSSRNSTRPPADVVLTYRKWRAARALRARFLVGERDRSYALWALPGRELDRLYRPPATHTVVYGAQPIWSVWEDGFEEQRLWLDSAPARWTDGEGELRIPLTGAPPAMLRVDIATIGPERTELTVRVNGSVRARRTLGRDGWTGDLRLRGAGVGRELLVQLESGRSYERGRRHGFSNRWRRGLLVRGITLLDREEAAVVTGNPEPEPEADRYDLSIASAMDERWTTADAPLVAVATVSNLGELAWHGHTRPRDSGGPTLRATWRLDDGDHTVRTPLPRPVLPGRSLRWPVALDPVDGRGEPLLPGRYSVELALERGGSTMEGPTVELPVRVRRHRPGRPFAPLRPFARHDPLPPPHFVLMPSELLP